MASGQQSNFLFLSELHPSKRRVAIRARVARAWDYNKDNKLSHFDLVLLDEQGNKIYAEIAALHADKFRDQLQEGNICIIRDFFVQNAKNMFRAVDGQFMIKITPWSKVEVQSEIPENFPRYAYSLTEFQFLPALVGKTESFIDVIGIISAISDLLKVRLPGQSTDSLKRNLQIIDINGTTMDVALWGSHATEFEANMLYDIGQTKPIIVLIVGTLMKNYRGHDTISCGEAGKLYVDPDIPEKTEYCECLGLQLPTLKWMTTEEDRFNITYQKNDPETVDLSYLLSTDPNEYLGKNMICTVTLLRLASEKWWFLSCKKCHKKAYSAGTEFTCSDRKCTSVAAGPRYKVRLIGADKTGEVEFVFFATVADQVIGKKIDILTRTSSHHPDTVPAEIAALVTQKFTLDFSVNEKGLEYGELSFQVNNIRTVHQKTNVFEFKQLTAGSKHIHQTEGSTSKQTPSIGSKISEDTLSQAQIEDTNTSESVTADDSHPPPILEQASVPSDTPLQIAAITVPPNKQSKSTPPSVLPLVNEHAEKRANSDQINPRAKKKLFK